MSFLQPFLLWALPLISLPIIIHLINQWRYQTKAMGSDDVPVASQSDESRLCQDSSMVDPCDANVSDSRIDRRYQSTLGQRVMEHDWWSEVRYDDRVNGSIAEHALER